MRLTYGNKLGGVPTSNIRNARPEEIRYSPIKNQDGSRNPLKDWRLYFKPSSDGGLLPEYMKDSEMLFTQYRLYEAGEFVDGSIAYAFRDIRLVPFYDETNNRHTELVAGNIIPGRWDLVADIYLYLKRDVVIESQGNSLLNEVMSGIIQSDVLLANGQLEYQIDNCDNRSNKVVWHYKFSVDEIESLSGITVSQKSITSDKDVLLRDRLLQERPTPEIFREGDFITYELDKRTLSEKPLYNRMVPLIKRGTVPKANGLPTEAGEYVSSDIGNIVKWNGFTLDSNEVRVGENGETEKNYTPIAQNIIWQTIWKTWMGSQFDNVGGIDISNPRLDDEKDGINAYYDGVLLALEVDGFPLKSDFAEGYYMPRSSRWLRVSTRLTDDAYKNICRGKTLCVEKLSNDDCSKMPFLISDINRRPDLDKYTLISKDTSKFYPIPGNTCYQGLPATYDALIHHEYTSSKECIDGRIGSDGKRYGSRVIKYKYEMVSSSQQIVEWENLIRNTIDKTCQCVEVSVQNPPYIDPNDPNECDILHTDTIYTICPDDGNYYYENRIVPANARPTRLEIRHIDRSNCHDTHTPHVYHKLSFEKDKLNGLSISLTEGAFHTSESLNAIYTSSIQGDSKKYYTDIVDVENTKQFALLYAHISGSGSLKIGEREKDTPSKINYSQYKLFTNDDTSTFSFYVNSISSSQAEHIYIIKFDKDVIKDRMDAGNLQISLANISNTSSIMTFVDTSHDSTNTKYFDDSPYYSFDLVSGSLLTGLHSTGIGTPTDNSSYTTYGKIYPNMGIIIFDADKLVTYLNFNVNTGSNIDVKNELQLFSSLKSSMENGKNLFARNTFREIVTYYFVRVPAHHANYSNNPTFAESPSEMGRIKNRNFFNEPVSYITTIGLYDDNKNLLAIGKLSKPVKKTMERELLFNLKLSV